MLARPLASLLLVVLLLPSAAAFSARHDAVELDYAAARSPVVITLGALDLQGDLRAGLVAAGVTAFDLAGIPTLSVIEQGQGLPQRTTFEHATLRMESGTLVWRFDGASALALEANASYAMAIALTNVPIPMPSGGDAGAGALLVSPGFTATGSWPDASSDILALHGVVSILRADGEAFPGWSHHAVNANAGSVQDADASKLGVVFHTDGAARMTLAATTMAGAVGSRADFTLALHTAEVDRFAETLDVLDGLAAELGAKDDQKGSPFGQDNPLKNLGAFSGILNGGMLIINGGDNGTAPPPTTSTMGDEPFDVGPINLLRSGEMRLNWSGDEMKIQGSPAVAVNQAGFAVAPTASVAGIIPVVSILLWVGALAAIVVFLVKRPPKVKVSWAWRLGGLAVWLVVLAVVFVIWDASFAETFGTSALTMLKAGSRDWAQLGSVFGVEMVPWSLAALMFALPVRIMAGVGLRYLGKGSSFSPVAKAGGLVALAILGPIYALWIVNVVIEQVVAYIGK